MGPGWPGQGKWLGPPRAAQLSASFLQSTSPIPGKALPSSSSSQMSAVKRLSRASSLKEQAQPSWPFFLAKLFNSTSAFQAARSAPESPPSSPQEVLARAWKGCKVRVRLKEVQKAHACRLDKWQVNSLMGGEVSGQSQALSRRPRIIIERSGARLPGFLP